MIEPPLTRAQTSEWSITFTLSKCQADADQSGSTHVFCVTVHEHVQSARPIMYPSHPSGPHLPPLPLQTQFPNSPTVHMCARLRPTARRSISHSRQRRCHARRSCARVSLPIGIPSALRSLAQGHAFDFVPPSGDFPLRGVLLGEAVGVPFGLGPSGALLGRCALPGVFLSVSCLEGETKRGLIGW